MAEYIERETLVERLTRNLNACNPGKFYEMCYQDAINTVIAFPAADVAPVRHGRWDKSVESKLDTHTGEYWEEEYYNCLECDYTSDWKSPYCPNCGARMDGGADHETD